MAVAKLFSSFKRSSVHMGIMDPLFTVHCMKNIPSEDQKQHAGALVQMICPYPIYWNASKFTPHSILFYYYFFRFWRRIGEVVF